MKGQAVVETVFCKLNKIRDGNRGGVCIQFQFDGAIILYFNFDMMQPLRIGFFILVLCPASGKGGGKEENT